jgi:hypothetical protein
VWKVLLFGIFLSRNCYSAMADVNIAKTINEVDICMLIV